MDKITKIAMYNYLNQCAKAEPYYMWGMDMEIITPQTMAKKIQQYGAEKYAGWEKKIGYYGCDCSGLLTPMTHTDKTAQGYFNGCKTTGNYTTRKTDFCLVFNGNSKSEITHVGVLIGNKTYEMYNRLDIKPAQGGRWKFFGIPEFFEQDDERENPAYTVDGDICIVNQIIAGYTTAENARNHKKPVTSVAAGRYYIYKKDIQTGAINVSLNKYSPGSWIY